MDASVLEILTALLSLVSAVGVLVVNGKVDRLTGRMERLTGRVDSLEGTVQAMIAAVMTGRSSNWSARQREPVTDRSSPYNRVYSYRWSSPTATRYSMAAYGTLLRAMRQLSAP